MPKILVNVEIIFPDSWRKQCSTTRVTSPGHGTGLLALDCVVFINEPFCDRRRRDLNARLQLDRRIKGAPTLSSSVSRLTAPGLKCFFDSSHGSPRTERIRNIETSARGEPVGFVKTRADGVENHTPARTGCAALCSLGLSANGHPGATGLTSTVAP